MEPTTTRVSRIACLNEVTPTSKVLAAIIFITLPFIGGFVGYQYGSTALKVSEEQDTQVLSNTVYRSAPSANTDLTETWENIHIQIGKVDTLEALMWAVHEAYSTLLDGEENTSNMLREYFHVAEWEESRVERLGVTLKLPPKVWKYSHEPVEECERVLVIEDENQSSSTLSGFFISPSPQGCGHSDPVKAYDGFYSYDPYETAEILLINAKTVDEIKGFLKGLVLSDLVTLQDGCEFDRLELYPSYVKDGFQYLFPMLPEDSESIQLAHSCTWSSSRPHIKFDPIRQIAVIMIHQGKWSHPDFVVQLSTGGSTIPSFDSQIFESIKFTEEVNSSHELSN